MAPKTSIKPVAASMPKNSGDPAQNILRCKRAFRIRLGIAAQKAGLACNPDNAVQNVSFNSVPGSALRQDYISSQRPGVQWFELHYVAMSDKREHTAARGSQADVLMPLKGREDQWH
jgi:hypothetical protein